MKRLPYIMHMRFYKNGRRKRFCVPLFLVLPLLVALVLALAPLVLVAAVILWPFGWGKPLLDAVPAVLRVIFSLHGLEIDIKKREEEISLYLR